MYQKPNPKLHTSSLIWALSARRVVIASLCIVTLTGMNCVLTPPNVAPTANAGVDQKAEVGQRVTLNGLGSTDADDDKLTYLWEQSSEPAVRLEDPNSEQPSFVTAEDGIYEFALTVTDGRGGSDISTVRIFVGDVPCSSFSCPRADAGADQTVKEGAAVTLRGCNSAEPCGIPLTFDWSQTSGPRVSINGIFICGPEFSTPPVDGDDVVLKFELTATNPESGCSKTDTVIITVQDRGPHPCDGVVCEDDGLFCNGVEGCESGACVSSGDPCGEGETCNELTSICEVEPDCASDADCDDGLFCNGAETCRIERSGRGGRREESSGKCVPGEPPCEEGWTCHEDTKGCEPPPCLTDEDCDDGEYCNGEEACVDGACVRGEPPCKGLACNEGAQNCECQTDEQCDDGVFCNGEETCSRPDRRGGQRECVPGEPPCEEDQVCNEETETCSECETDEQCDDGLFCTGVETCVNGECISDGSPCLPDEVCIEDTQDCVPGCPLPFKFVSETFASGARQPSDVRLVDVNNDLVLDLVVAHTGYYNKNDAVAVHFGLGDGRFKTPDLYDGGNAPSRVRAGDVNADGFVDLVVTSQVDKAIAIFFGTVESLFSEPTKIQLDEGPVGLALADLNADHDLDIVVTLKVKGEIATLLGRGDGTFDSPRFADVGVEPNNVIAVDLDGDTVLDLAVTNSGYYGKTVSILIGAGDGGFLTQQTIELGSRLNSIAAGYFNDDGFVDLAVARRYVGVTVLYGAPNGRFPTQVSVPTGGAGVSVTNIDGDEFDDIVTAARGGEVVILLSNGDNGFQTSSHQAGDDPEVPVVGDLDGDADVDIVVRNSGAALTVLRNHCRP